ncbi:hypothetical protein SFUMM280S_06895 [Streptomyces fumanus]
MSPTVPNSEDLPAVVGAEPVTERLLQRELRRVRDEREQFVAQHAVAEGDTQLLELLPRRFCDVVGQLQPGDHPLLEVGGVLGRHPAESEGGEEQGALVGGLQLLEWLDVHVGSCLPFQPHSGELARMRPISRVVQAD